MKFLEKVPVRLYLVLAIICWVLAVGSGVPLLAYPLFKTFSFTCLILGLIFMMLFIWYGGVLNIE